MLERGRAYLVEVDGEGLRWAKGSASGTVGQECVELARWADEVLVRSSRNRVGARLSYTSREWVKFLDWLRKDG